MARSAPDIQADLNTVNSALQELISGNRLTRLQLGSGEFARTYEHQEITYESLKQEKAELQAELDSLTVASAIVFRASSIPLVVTKLPRGY